MRGLSSKEITSPRLGQNNLVAFFQGDDGFFPVRCLAGLAGTLAAGFSVHVHRVDARDFDFEEFLHGLADLRFGGATVSYDSVLVILFTLSRAFFREADRFNNFKSVHVLSTPVRVTLSPIGIPLFQTRSW